MTEETWLPVPGYEGLYEVSDFGRVRSLPRPRAKGDVLKPGVANNGYVRVSLCRDGGVAQSSVHTLVMLAFVGLRPAGLQVRHLDGNPLNNQLSNLAYGTAAENAEDRRLHGTHRNTRKTECLRGHPFQGPNLIIDSNGRRTCRTCSSELGRMSLQRRGYKNADCPACGVTMRRGSLIKHLRRMHPQLAWKQWTQ